MFSVRLVLLRGPSVKKNTLVNDNHALSHTELERNVLQQHLLAFLSESYVNGGRSTWKARVKWKQRCSFMKRRVITYHWSESTVIVATWKR